MKGCAAMETFLFKFSSILLILLISLIQMHGYKACFETERLALLEIKSFFISVGDIEYVEEILTSWVDDPKFFDCCDWERVKCNTTTRRVMQLSLNDMTKFNSQAVSLLNLSLFIPFENLQSLDLSYNFFEDVYENKVYDKLEILKQLKILNLGFNNFSDSMLPFLNTLTSLTTLILAGNGIEGFKPKLGLTNLRNLQALDLSDNSNITSGSLTRLGLANLTSLKGLQISNCGISTFQGLAKLKNLEVLDLSYNFINDSLESQGICELKNLFELDLSGNEFEGHLAPCFNNFTHIKVLDISSNQLSGNLPSAIVNLTTLEYLALSKNNFVGLVSFCSLNNLSKLEVFQLSVENNLLQVVTENCLPTFQLKVVSLANCNLNVIPNFLLHQYNLKYLDLSDNKLAGDFPTWLLENNTKLGGLYLTNNSLSGILQLSSAQRDLQFLDISSNNFIGKLPYNIGIILPKLVYIDMSKNNFEGNIPSSIGEMKELSLLDLSRNNFSSELSRSIVIGCFSLKWLDLSYNNLNGQIFPKVMNLTQLRWLYLNNNHFSGNVKDGLLTSSALQTLDISKNILSGHIPPWISKFSNLEVLLMSENRLEGNIPVQLNNLKRLEILNISENSLSGSISPISNLASVKYLYAQKNAFSGLIPIAFFKSSALMILDLSYNKFCGRIPYHINEHSNLYGLLLKGNHLLGPIPNQLCQLRKLGIMDLSSNQLNGSIPSCITNTLSRRVGNENLYEFIRTFSPLDFNPSIVSYYNSNIYLWLDGKGYRSLYRRVEDLFMTKNGKGNRSLDRGVQVQFMTKKRYEIYEGSILELMRGLDLSNNKLTGDIPSEIGDLQDIRTLNLSHNSLSGSIPESFSHLKMIESLDLSHNKLSGRIPHEMTALNFLSNFNVSYNNLSGPTPNAGQFANFDGQNYGHNPGLCGPRINMSCAIVLDFPETPSNEAEEDVSAIDMVAFYWSFVASCVTVILGLLAILCVNPHWRRLWFYFIEKCIDACYYWLFKYIFYR